MSTKSTRHTLGEVNISYKLPADRKNVVFGFLRKRFRRWGVKSECRQSGSSLKTGLVIRKALKCNTGMITFLLGVCSGKGEAEASEAI
jgi:hypothetical protein